MNYQEYAQESSQRDKYGIPFPPKIMPRIHLNPHLPRKECLEILLNIELKFDKIKNKGIEISKDASEIEEFISKCKITMKKNINETSAYNYFDDFFKSKK